ncbi:MAG: CoA-binding protein [Actinomycetota bacterium]
MNDKQERIEYLFNPGSIAFIGATQAKIKWGFVIFNNLLCGGYSGKVYPVNPGLEEVMGLKCYPSVRDIPFDVDLAVFTVPAAQVLASMKDCLAKGIKAALVISAGFRELGERGAGMEAELVAMAENAGIAMAGPNGQGVCCPANDLYPWMPIFYPRGGGMGFVSQSGNILNMLIGHALDAGYGVSKAVSGGNEASLRTEDYLAYLARDPGTHVIVSYIEGVDRGREFFGQAARATRSKPVVLLKGGRTASGVRAARSHTGAIAVSEALFDSACRQAGVTLARDIREAGVTASAFVNRPLPRGRRVGIVTGGGGLGVLAADACAEHGLEVPALSATTLETIGALLPPYWVPGNPVDLVAGLDLSVVRPVLETVIRSGEVDSVLFIFIESQRSKGIRTIETSGLGFDVSAAWDMMTLQLGKYLEELYGIARETGVPLYVASNFGLVQEPGQDRSADLDTCRFEDVESACRAMRAMADYREYRECSTRG